MSFFSSISAAISAGLKELGAGLARFAQVVKPVVQATANELGEAALAAVLEQAPLVISGQEKLGGAVTNVQAALVAQGKTASLTLIQASVQEAHDLLAQAVHPPTP